MKKALIDLLSEEEFVALQFCFDEAEHLDLQTLIKACRKHVKMSRKAAEQRSVVNVELAEQICAAYESLMREWNMINEDVKHWIKAGMFYFVMSDDDEPDFESQHGFDDDRLILNVCLKRAGFIELCI